jgi:hypothetical protein
MAATLETYKDVLARLYVEEDKSLKEIMEHMRDKYNVNIGYIFLSSLML